MTLADILLYGGILLIVVGLGGVIINSMGQLKAMTGSERIDRRSDEIKRRYLLRRVWCRIAAIGGIVLVILSLSL